MERLWPFAERMLGGLPLNKSSCSEFDQVEPLGETVKMNY